MTAYEGQTPQTVLLNGKLVCNLVQHKKSLAVRRFFKRTGDMWNRAPQWVRDGAKGAIFLTNMGANIAGNMAI